MEELLKKFSRREELKPLCDLDRNDLDCVFEKASVKSLAPRTLITPDEKAITFLLEGQVSLMSGGFVVESFAHTDQRGLMPLFDDCRSEDAALLTSHGAILEVDRKLFEGLHSQHQHNNPAAKANSIEDEEQFLFDELRRAFKADRLQLPALPEAALKIRQVINQSSVGTSEIIQIVQTDPILSARLIKVANSPLYGTWREIKTVRDAVRRLGLETTRGLSFSLSVKQLFHARSSMIKQQLKQMYDESIQVSSLAYVITQKRAKNLDPEQALLAGLLARLGVIPILKYVDENPGLISSIDMLHKSLIHLNVPISRLIFDRWNFDEQFLSVVECSQDWYRDTGKEADYVDIVIAARLLFFKKTNQLDESINIYQLAVADKLKLFGEDEYGLDFLDQAKNEIDEMQEMLRL